MREAGQGEEEVNSFIGKFPQSALVQFDGISLMAMDKPYGGGHEKRSPFAKGIPKGIPCSPYGVWRRELLKSTLQVLPGQNGRVSWF